MLATPVPIRVSPAKSEGIFSSPEKRNLVLSLLLVLATLALYNPVRRHPFVNYDDDRYVTDNTHVRAGMSWPTIQWAFTTFDEANWHPLTWLSHALDCQVFGMKPAGPHYVNLLLHALNVVLLFWVLREATASILPSLMVAALFAIHPVNVESVAWIAERKNILSMMLFLLALAAYGWYVRKPGIGRYLTVAALFACGLMAKPMVITLPFVLLLWDYWPLQRRETPLATLILEKLPLLALSAASAVITLKAQHAGDAIGSITQYPISVRLGNSAISYARYLGKALWPTQLAPMYPLRADSMSGLKIIGAIAFLAVMTAVVVMFRQKRYLLVGWFWFLGTLVPMIGLVQVGRQAMADRYAYLPFIGLFIAACWGLADALKGKRTVPIVAGAALLTFAALTHRQLGYWADNVTLWSHTLEVTKDNFIAEDNLGGALIEAARIDDAMPHFRAAAALEPTDPMSRMNLAADAQRHGQYSLAVQDYKTLIAATRDPRFRATALTDLGYCYRELEDTAAARQSFREAVSLRPRTLRAWVGLGLVDYRSADYSAAAADYTQALSIQPWDLGYYLLARALDKAGHSQQSQAAMLQAKQTTDNFEELQKSAESLLSK